MNSRKNFPALINFWLFTSIFLSGCIAQNHPESPQPLTMVTPTTIEIIPKPTPLPSTNTPPQTLIQLPSISEKSWIPELYFTTSDLGLFSLARTTANCLLEKISCSEIQIIPGYEEQNTIIPLLWAPNGGYAALISDPDGDGNQRIQLYIPNNNSWQTLIDTSAGIFSLAWSPESNQIAYSTSDGGFFLLQVETGTIKPIFNDTIDQITDLSWMGNQIFYTSLKAGNSEIMAFDIQSQQLINLSNTPSWDGFPTFSPDNKKIAFVSDREGSRGLYLMNPDGSNVRTISTSDELISGKPVWSPNGDWLAFTQTSIEHSSPPELYAIHSDGSNLTKISTQSGWSPIWISNTQLLFQQQDNGLTHIFMVTFPEGKVQRLDIPGLALEEEWLEPSWRP